MCKLLLLFGLALACCSLSLAATRSLKFWHHQSTRARTQLQYSPELVRDAKDFIALIPQVVIDEIVAEHTIIDAGFRKAVKFLRSSEFKQLQQRAELLPEVIEIISFLHLNETAARTQLRPQQQLLVPQQQHDYSYSYKHASEEEERQRFAESVVVVLMPESEFRVEPTDLGDFAGFAEELLSHLPRDRFVALINEKRKSGTVFPKFYEALRSDRFKQLVEAAMKSSNVLSLINTLASHSIDAQRMKAIAYEVISWGPAV
ncbi:hypothetical protein KR222_004116 [Zaprionus bogoriensis]|nr:hypothetical protein KR222_004116 [Zaprionus bogoriensis]